MCNDIDLFFESVQLQIYANREKHDDEKKASMERMALICGEQVGQLQAAVASGDMDAVAREIGHVGAIVYEVFCRLPEPAEKKK